MDRPSKRGSLRGRVPAPERLPGEKTPEQRLTDTLIEGAKAEQRSDYRQAALELNAAIHDALAWIATGAEPAVAHAQLRKATDKWRALLEEDA